MSVVIGLVGEKGSGKGTFARLFAEAAPDKKNVAMRFSDILRETLDIWHIPTTRTNLQKLAVVMDEALGAGSLSNAIYERVIGMHADIVILDGVRWETDVALIRRFSKNLLIYVTASPEMRYRRTLVRGENAGERETSFEQFMQEELAANETGIPRIGADADCVIRNQGTVEEYKSAIVECCRTRTAPLF